ncbi:peroxidase family protein [Microseira wollei]|uniref:Heme peroxidase n=1 Tax=Microseira wollei NIES-4236 TaxID=2530354 RepID=A0AAV3XDP8_9CYAN|nr:peroxidase family protein [Microseira wollei]GET38482.1 putative heme peroxidase [Microseira wollei NIES-4236]
MFGIPWHKLPTPIALFKLLQFRNALRENNLHDTSQIPNKDELPKPVPSPSDRHLVVRTADGSYNDLDHPEMGMAGTRFGRNVPLSDAKVDAKNLLNPNPRNVSRVLLTRDKFHPATILNLNAASWIQFQTHDWFTHGNNQPDNKVEIPVEEDDPWRQEYGKMEVKKTLADPTRHDNSNPPTFINEVTHWWDASQIYGSNQETINKLRSHVDGKMIIDRDGFLPMHPTDGIDDVGFPGTWWVGLSMLHTLFVKEHNAICDRLKQEYPEWSDDDLFDHARLINAALLAKIHTVEWTPAILPHPATKIAMNTNWWGLLGQDFKKMLGRIGDSEMLSGIIGSSTDHHTAPYYLTEEFVSVYRMHPLIPDELEFYSHQDGRFVVKKEFREVFGKQTRGFMEEVKMSDLFYSFGIAHPGAVTLHNYPHFLRQLVKDDGEIFDLAAVDIIRDRERGVPRYNRFREIMGRGRVKSFAEITSNPQWAKELREVYNNDIDSVDLMVGLFAEDLPEGFGFSDTAFRVFILMASRRLKSDRFFTKDYRAEIYTQLGLDWIDNNSFLTVLRRHHPELAPALVGVENGFAPWRRLGTPVK